MSTRKHLRLKDFSTEFAVGAFFLAALIILAVFTVILSKDNLFSEQWTVDVRFPSVSGLNVGNEVLARGVKVGTVKSISLQNSNVLVTLSLDSKIIIRKGYSIKVRYSSMLGGRYVAIKLGDPEKQKVPLSEPLQGEPSADVLANTADFIHELKTEVSKIKKELDETDFISNLTKLIDNAEEITSHIKAGKGSMGKILMKDEFYNTANDTMADINSASKKITTTADNINNAVTDARNGKGTLGKILTDDKLYTNTNEIIADIRKGDGSLGKLIRENKLYDNSLQVSENLKALSARLEKGDSTIGYLMQDNGNLYKALLKTAENTRDISTSLEEGKGTIGQFLKDEELYNDIRKTVNEIREAVEDMREQAPISTFGNFIFGAL